MQRAATEGQPRWRGGGKRRSGMGYRTYALLMSWETFVTVADGAPVSTKKGELAGVRHDIISELTAEV